MIGFNSLSLGESYAQCDIAVADRLTREFVFFSVVGYDSIIKKMVSESKKQKTMYRKGLGHGKTSEEYEVEVKKRPGDDFSHAVFKAKDMYDENINQLVGYILHTSQDELKDAVMKKIVKYTPVPVLDEWKEYIFSTLMFDGKITDCIIAHGHEEEPFECKKLVVNSSELISYISNGLKNRDISIDGENETTDYMRDVIGLNNYLNSFSETLAVDIQNSFKPKFIPGESELDYLLDEFDRNCFDNDIELFNAQKYLIQASVNNLRKNDASFVIAEMGSGKEIAVLNQYL